MNEYPNHSYDDSRQGSNGSVQWDDWNYSGGPFREELSGYPSSSGYNHYYGGAGPVYQPQPSKPSGGGRKALATVALMLSCALLGAGGGYVAASSMQPGGGQTVVYKEPQQESPTAQGITNAEDFTVSDIAAKASQSSVSITTENLVTNPYTGGRIVSGAGSGVILSEDGYILTNAHVVQNANNIVVTLPDGSEHAATLIGADEQTDVAVVKINVTGLTPVTLGDSDQLQVGDFCIAIGNPLGTLGGTVTDGIISALNRQITIDGHTMNLLQMSAAVSPGNSGGGLFDAKGNLIGIVNAKSGDGEAEGLGFAIPINTAMQIAEQLLANGYVAGRPVLGVSLQTIETAEQAAMGGVEEPGLYVMELTPGGPAEAAGVQVGDRIVSANGTALATHADLAALLAGHAPGDKLTLQLERNGQLWKVVVTLGELRPQTH